MYILLFGQVLMGLGTTPLYTLGIAYIEDSVAKNKAPIYLGKKLIEYSHFTYTINLWTINACLRGRFWG